MARWNQIPNDFCLFVANNICICFIDKFVILQPIVHMRGLLTMFNLCLTDLSYIILKETTADHRTVRTQHILDTTHNDDES